MGLPSDVIFFRRTVVPETKDPEKSVISDVGKVENFHVILGSMGQGWPHFGWVNTHRIHGHGIFTYMNGGFLW